MDASHWPLILIEGVLVAVGALVFGWWQLRSLARERRAAQQGQRAAGEAADSGQDGTKVDT